MVEEHDVSRIISVFGGNRRRSRWLLAGDTSVLNVFGRSCLDLREVECRSGEVSMTVLAVLGSVTILVPEGADVRLSGASFLASSDCLVARTGDASPLPPLMVTATTVMGRTKVVSLPAGVEAPRRKRRVNQRKAAQRAAATRAAQAWERALVAESAPSVDAAAAVASAEVAARIIAASEAPDDEPMAADGPILPAPTLLDAPFDPSAFARAAE